MQKPNKADGLPFLGSEETAIAIGYDVNLLIRQRYCEWCLFWDFEKALQMRSDSLPAKLGVVIFSGTIPKVDRARIVRKLKRRGFTGVVRPASSGLPAMQAVLESLFGQRIREGKRGPFLRPIFVRPNPDPEYSPAIVEEPQDQEIPEEKETDPSQEKVKKKPKGARPGGNRKHESDFPVAVIRNPKTGGLEMVTNLTREQLVANLELDSDVSDKQLRDRVLEKLVRINAAARRKKA